MKPERPEPIEKLVEQFFRAHGQEQRFKELKVFEIWKQAVGEEISKNAQPVSVQQGRLVVTVRNSIWLQELGFQRHKLKSKLNRLLGKGIIKEISFRIGPLKEADDKTEPSLKAENPINPELEQKLAELLKEVQDPELQAELKKLLYAIQNWFH